MADAAVGSLSLFGVGHYYPNHDDRLAQLVSLLSSHTDSHYCHRVQLLLPDAVSGLAVSTGWLAVCRLQLG